MMNHLMKRFEGKPLSNVESAETIGDVPEQQKSREEKFSATHLYNCNLVDSGRYFKRLRWKLKYER